MIDTAREVVARALQAGATDAECVFAEGDEFSATVRLGEVCPKRGCTAW
jgi:hypothetical protein